MPSVGFVVSVIVNLFCVCISPELVICYLWGVSLNQSYLPIVKGQVFVSVFISQLFRLDNSTDLSLNLLIFSSISNMSFKATWRNFVSLIVLFHSKIYL